MKLVTITNNCEQCGVKYSHFTIDPPYSSNGKDWVQDSIRRQKKEVIEPNHKGHAYTLKVEVKK